MDRDIIREAVKGSCDELYRSVEARMSRLALCVWMGEEVLQGWGCDIEEREMMRKRGVFRKEEGAQRYHRTFS